MQRINALFNTQTAIKFKKTDCVLQKVCVSTIVGNPKTRKERKQIFFCKKNLFALFSGFQFGYFIL
jgi:hypothetical protein